MNVDLGWKWTQEKLTNAFYGEPKAKAETNGRKHTEKKAEVTAEIDVEYKCSFFTFKKLQTIKAETGRKIYGVYDCAVDTPYPINIR